MPENYPDLDGLTVRQLREFCRERKIAGYSKCPRKADLLAFIRDWIAQRPGDVESEEGGQQPQATDERSLDVAFPASAAGDGETPDVALADYQPAPTSGALELLPVAETNELVGKWLGCKLPHLLYSTNRGNCPTVFFPLRAPLVTNKNRPKALLLKQTVTRSHALGAIFAVRVWVLPIVLLLWAVQLQA